MNTTPPVTQNQTPVDIDSLDVSDAWKKYFHAVNKFGGLGVPKLKAMPQEERRAHMKEVGPPLISLILAFAFPLIYYIVKGMWKKGLVLFAITVPVTLIISVILYMIGGETLAGIVRFLPSAVFSGLMAQNYYAYKVLKDDGWMPLFKV
ncbi:hypothetical protein CO614_07815 [Lysobacteraceae bacterium NML120232]|nr:hypothetical protein CO608_04520 [Xanthomonadaceae bacterium NML08-0793]PJK10698.1 hypothetical protein CO614_07815 [Xanthomonadaceae bacterium NML120232]